MRWLRSLIHSHAIGEAVHSARTYSKLAKACNSRSSHQFDAWANAAFRHRQERRYWMDMARKLAG
jgi:hypothetical protein